MISMVTELTGHSIVKGGGSGPDSPLASLFTYQDLCRISVLSLPLCW